MTRVSRLRDVKALSFGTGWGLCIKIYTACPLPVLIILHYEYSLPTIPVTLPSLALFGAGRTAAYSHFPCKISKPNAS